MARSRNPIGFTPLPVTIFTSAVYVALFAVLLVVHHVVPSAPTSPTPSKWPGVNITEAWLDLEELSASYHPYNSKANVDARAWLLERIGSILDENKVEWVQVKEKSSSASLDTVHSTKSKHSKPSRSVTVFDDNRSTVTYDEGPKGRPYVNYFEGTNLVVYIRGSEDDEGDWWTTGAEYEGLGGVLVNAHYDSVSTGFGATDDGVGCITVLQLISHFTTKGNQPKKGIVALLNNGEEDGLYGAYAFARHPMAKFPHTFLNLEGAGAGGRATLFRSTDAEVTKFYSGSEHPFGSVISGDGFKRGLVRSGTDYSVFTEKLGMRGLDVAFMAPRARYHSSQDDARDTSVDSLWHMLSAALSTVDGLSNDMSSTFEKASEEDDETPTAGKGSTGVWFDLLGMAFAVLELHSLFAISVTLLVACPIILITLEVFIQRSGKWYPFSRKSYLHSSDDDEPISLNGFRGFFRFPLAFVFSTAAVVALAYLVMKINPYILYSSEYAVWTMMLTAWLSVTWFFLRLFDAVRPTALSRFFTLIWLYVLAWIALVLVTVGENQMKIGSGYFVVIYNGAVFTALLISYLELFALPKKDVFVEHTVFGPGADEDERRGSLTSHQGDRPPSRGRASNAPADNDDANERTSLLNNTRQTFTRYGAHGRRSEDNEQTPLINDPLLNQAYEGEQAWSSSLPSWTWFLQFLLLAPINIILVGQIALLATSALHQTPADGNPVFVIYVVMAALSVLLLLPLAPFLHRVTYHVPTFLFLVFIGTLVYNLVAFPFSRDSQLKLYFVQNVNLDNSKTYTALIGLDPYVEEVVSQMPSAAGQQVICTDQSTYPWADRNGLISCVWEGLTPNLVPEHYRSTASPRKVAIGARRYHNDTKPETKMADWLSFNATRHGNSSHITFSLQGLNTHACRIYFDTPVSNILVHGSGTSWTPEPGQEAKGSQLKLWSREADQKFVVSVTEGKNTNGQSGGGRQKHERQTYDKIVGVGSKLPLTGKVMCQWADANQIGTIPALDEVKRFMPVWSTVSKHSDGLVEGWKEFSV